MKINNVEGPHPMKHLWERDHLIGEKVIVRSNEDEPYLVGTFKGWAEGWHDKDIPLVEIDGKEYSCFGCVVPLAMEELLKGKSPREQWDLCCYFVLYFQQLFKQPDD